MRTVGSEIIELRARLAEVERERDEARAQVKTLLEALDRIMGEADCQHAVAIATDALTFKG